MAGGSAKSTNKARKDAKRPSRNKSPETESEATNLSEEIGKKKLVFCRGILRSQVIDSLFMGRPDFDLDSMDWKEDVEPLNGSDTE